MNAANELLTATAAARQLGVSVKALRVYEARGLIAPQRTAAGWRVYGPEQMNRAREVIGLRALGFGLGEMAALLDGPTQDLEQALSAQQRVLAQRLEEQRERMARVRRRRRDMARNDASASASPAVGPAGVSFALPWPWGGETFRLGPLRALTFIVGPLGSGKTRLARRIAEAVPGAVFLPMERAGGNERTGLAQRADDPARRARVERAMARLAGAGATPSPELSILLTALEDPVPSAVIVDMVEEGLDAATQRALMADLRRAADLARPVFLMTRSSAILDLAAAGDGESIVFCPANHAPPMIVEPFPGEPGLEALASCLAAPDVRARTAGVIAWRPPSVLARQL
tara:strand:- start:72 stop:1106 length:1035 start_codon:yes stop_codon:yes gene_type:complete